MIFYFKNVSRLTILAINRIRYIAGIKQVEIYYQI